MTRRSFLKLCGLGLTSLAFRPMLAKTGQLVTGKVGRVAVKSVSIYSRPDDTSTILYQRFRDDLVNLYYEVMSEFGPDYNPKWYRVWGGYVHSAHIQQVEQRYNTVLKDIPTQGLLTEVSVPFTQSMVKKPKNVWEPVYRLYYLSTHWIVGQVDGPNGRPWYQIKDELGDMVYYAEASHFRPIPSSELTPIHPEVPMGKKWIQVSIAQQSLTAYEGKDVVMKTRIASGVPQIEPVPGQVPTDTPTGMFNVESKMPSKHMGDGYLTGDLEAYELPGVPWVSFFAENGVALHGTYWHDNYGITMSHGCVNMRADEAKWIFRWTTPIAKPDEWEKRGYGTVVQVV